MVRAPRRWFGRSSSAFALTALLALGACGTSAPEAAPSPAPSSAASSGSSSPASAPSASPGSGSTPADAAAAFCGEIRANGATGASFGPIPTFYRKKPLLADVRGKLEAMGTVGPPAEIAAPWALQKRTLRRAEAAGRKLAAGQTLADVPDVDLRSFSGGAIDKAQDTLTDYYFAHCR